MLKVHYVKEDATHTLRLDGVLDISTVEIFEDLHLFGESGGLNENDTLVLDFSALQLIDSTGIGAILKTIYMSKEKGFHVYLEGMSEMISDILETVGVLKVLESIKEES